MQTSTEPIIKFWDRVHVDPAPGACWTWRGTIGTHGYGMIQVRGSGARRWRMMTAHRWLYEYLHGPLGGLLALHRCDNPPCVRPSHLWSGTHGDNHRDKIAKGRQHLSLFSEIDHDELCEVRSLYERGFPFAAIAAGFGVSTVTIVRALRSTLR